jgi:RNA polymerase sigma-70 factor (ECF subfamily)
MAVTNEFAQRVHFAAGRLAAEGVDALAAMFDLTSQRLVRFAAAITRHQQDAEDAVQAALVRLASQPRLLASADSPWSYLLRMVRNEALVIGRRKQRWETASNLADLVTRCRVDLLELEESQREVWAALRELPAEQAEVVVLKIWETMTFAQIAEVLEISPNTAASRYQYAMAKLTARLSPKTREVAHEA